MKHGKANTYRRHGCRCEPCRRAATEERRRYQTEAPKRAGMPIYRVIINVPLFESFRDIIEFETRNERLARVELNRVQRWYLNSDVLVRLEIQMEEVRK